MNDSRETRNELHISVRSQAEDIRKVASTDVQMQDHLRDAADSEGQWNNEWSKTGHIKRCQQARDITESPLLSPI